MKKQILAVMMAAMALQAATPKQSHALVALAASPVLAPTVLAAMGIGGGLMVVTGGFWSVSTLTDLSFCNSGSRGCAGNHAIFGTVGADAAVSVGILIAGVILLDETGQAPSEFAVLSAAKAQKLGISEVERVAYNSELDESNSILQSATRKAIDQKITNSRKLEGFWKESAQQLRPETYSALKKVSKGMAEAINNQKAI